MYLNMLMLDAITFGYYENRQRSYEMREIDNFFYTLIC